MTRQPFRYPVEKHWPGELSLATVRTFVETGWAPENWYALDRAAASSWDSYLGQDFANRATLNIRGWLRHPPEFMVKVSPGLAWETYWGWGGSKSPGALDAFAAGVPWPFILALLGFHPRGIPRDAWATALELCGSEAGVLGWTATGWLIDDLDQADRCGSPVQFGRIAGWTARFGPAAYLWVLAGFTLDEATALKDTGGVTDEQLRVMAALNGATLPAGI